MVKRLDEPIDHIGWDLWQAAAVWQSRFQSDMVAAGHAWFAEARGGVLAHLDRTGNRQSDVATRMGVSKQAVQQLVDGLVADGVVERRADPTDARARWVVLTARGRAVHADADRIKRAIESEWQKRLGKSAFAALRRALRDIGRPQ